MICKAIWKSGTGIFDYYKFPITTTDPKGPDAFFADSQKRTASGGSCDSDYSELGQLGKGHRVMEKNRHMGLRLVRNDENHQAVVVADKGAPIEVFIGEYPSKKVYNLGERFEMNGMVVNLKYADGTVEKAERPAIVLCYLRRSVLALGRPFTWKGTVRIHVTCKVGNLECEGVYDIEVR
jgi:hypothetical protein